MKDIFRKSFAERFEIDYIIFALLSFIRGTKDTMIGRWITSLFFIKPIMPFIPFFMIIAFGFILLRYVKNPKHILWIMVAAYLILEILLS